MNTGASNKMMDCVKISRAVRGRRAFDGRLYIYLVSCGRLWIRSTRVICKTLASLFRVESVGEDGLEPSSF